ncbi:MAG TPA: hypothetical protein VJT31_01445 [Rugosimonospora sp.]|nr:hypothetical protein [Rugosimonospora sp.]
MTLVSRRILLPLATILAVSAVDAVAPLAAHASADLTPPSVPANVRQVGPNLPASTSTVTWNASTDVAGTVAHYWVNNLTFGNRVRPRATSTTVLGLLAPWCTVPHGTTITITVQAVDAAGNVSAPSAPLQVRIA